MSNNHKNLEAQMESYNRNLLEAEVKKRYIDTGILNEELIEKYLQNGLEVKASGKETINAVVVQLEQDGVAGYGRPLYNLSATFNPQIHINEEGYVTQAWFDMSWIQDIQTLSTGGYKALMKPAYFRPFDPIRCFECYIDEVKKHLLPSPMLDDCP